MRRIGTTALVVLVAGLAFAAGASALSPDVEKMNLQAADVPGAKVVNEHPVTQKGYVAAHFRSFTFAAPNKGVRLVGIESVTALAASASTAVATVASDQKLVSTSARRKAIAKAIAKNAGVKASAVAVGAPRSVAGYDQGFALTIGVAVKSGHALNHTLVRRALATPDAVLVVEPRAADELHKLQESLAPALAFEEGVA